MPRSAAAPIMSRFGPPPGMPKIFRTPAADSPSASERARSRAVTLGLLLAAGTAKAAEDGWVLAEELEKAGGDVPAALAAWESRQLALGSGLLARTREIGDSSQFTGGFRPGDPRLIFGLYGPGR